MERLLWIICVGIVKLKGFLKVGEEGRTGGQRDEMQDSPTLIPGFENGAGRGTWAIREIISTSLWRHQKDMHLMITMHHVFSKLLKFTNVLSSRFPSSFSSSVSIDGEMTNTVDPQLFKDSVFVSSSLAKIYDTQISRPCAFVCVCGHVWSDRNIWVPRDSCYQLTLHQLMLCLLLLGCKQMSFPWSLGVTIFTFVLGDFDI